MKWFCNVCGAINESERCRICNSSLRMRAVIHTLTCALFNKSMTIDEIPMSKHIKGVGMSDWNEYAKRLKVKFDYTNTFYDKEPKLDITKDVPTELYDFVISSDVLEHVQQPIQLAFDNLYKMLKKGGYLILTVPYMFDEHTREHYPNLHKWEIKNEKLYNTTIDGKKEVFENLHYHGGAGLTLEMRVFSRHDLKQHLYNAGFEHIEIVNYGSPKYNINYINEYSLPLIVRK